jgi:hypothetical protein
VTTADLITLFNGASVVASPVVADVPSSARNGRRGKARAQSVKSAQRVGHRHRCPGGEYGVPRADRCPRTLWCTASGCERRVFYRCVCCKLDGIEARIRRRALLHAALRPAP